MKKTAGFTLVENLGLVRSFPKKRTYRRSAALLHSGHLALQTAGFTLVEILIVLVILAVIGGMTALSLSRDVSGELRREARQLIGALETATDRARWQHQLLGLATLPDSTGWQFLVITQADGDTQTLVINDDASLNPHRLRDGMRYRPLTYGGAEAAPETILPILPSGRFEPFTLELRLEDRRILLTLDPLGRISSSDVVSLP